MNRFFQLKKYLWYQWKAKTKYYLHSPFVYSFYINVLEGKEDIALQPIDQLRRKLRSDNSLVEIKELGTGQYANSKVSDIEKNVAIPEKYGRLLYRLVCYFKANNIVEIGTSIGISAAYMALAAPGAQIISLEGSPQVIDVARKNHSILGIKNIRIVEGNFDETLFKVLPGIPSAGLVFFDGNHTKEATMRYFALCLEKATENSIFIFDDIYRSQDMSEAWDLIKQSQRVRLSIDLFQWGICFFKKEKLAKEDFILRY